MHAFGCAVEWGFLTLDDAKELMEEGEKRAGEDGKLSLEEAGVSDKPLEMGGDKKGKGCGPAPELPENPTEEDADRLWDEIAGEDGMIDEHEARAALGCAVEWGFLTEDEAKEIFKAGTEAAGDNGKLSKKEAESMFADDVAEE